MFEMSISDMQIKKKLQLNLGAVRKLCYTNLDIFRPYSGLPLLTLYIINEWPLTRNKMLNRDCRDAKDSAEKKINHQRIFSTESIENNEGEKIRSKLNTAT